MGFCDVHYDCYLLFLCLFLSDRLHHENIYAIKNLFCSNTFWVLNRVGCSKSKLWNIKLPLIRLGEITLFYILKMKIHNFYSIQTCCTILEFNFWLLLAMRSKLWKCLALYPEVIATSNFDCHLLVSIHSHGIRRSLIFQTFNFINPP